MMRTLNIVCWMWTLAFAMVLAEKLGLFFADIDDGCWAEGSVHNAFDTIFAAIEYATSHTNGQLTSKDINLSFTYVPGCSMVEAQQIYTIINFLRRACFRANSSAGYSVFVGPRLGSNCHFITDWIALGIDSHEAHKNLYQISYLCPTAQSFRHSETALTGITSFTVNMKDYTLGQALEIFLRQRGWKNIALLYETSPLVLQYREIAKNLEFHLSRAAPDRERLNVIAVHNLQLDGDPREIVERFCAPCQAIILLASPATSYYLIDTVDNMSIFENSETAIIQVDPSNAITYDVLRLWRYHLSTQGALGTAAQCTFMMTALPAGHGFNISSYILKSNIHVSLASAVALAIRLTYVNFAEGDGIPPANMSFFSRISEETLSVPVLPNVTYRFTNYDDDAIEFYDFYFFTFTPAISVEAINISDLDFEEVFEISNVLLNQRQTFTTVNTKMWPNPNRHPRSDFCLLSRCHQDLLWTAPEILRHPLQHPLGTQKGDIYSFAIIAHEIFCHSPPFGDCDLTVSDILERIRSGTPVFRPRIEQGSIASTVKELIEISWSESPEFRPTFEEISKRFHMIGDGRDVNIADHMLTLMQKYSAKLETEVQERTVELEEEKQKTEDLIAKMLPLPVAQALVAGNPVDPEAFDDVTIYFSDIVGFCLISAKSTPLQIVNLLNDIYSLFDATIEKFDVYKVETIGDAYMVASGLPIRNSKRHAGEVASMALELLSLSGSLVIRHLPDVPILLRIGIHSGRSF
ncbi:Retinal guanylyl cyclase 1 [Sparganum proliferum]